MIKSEVIIAFDYLTIIGERANILKSWQSLVYVK